MRLFWLIIVSFCVCSSTPTGDVQLSDEGDNVLETRIASVENKVSWMETNFDKINKRIGQLEGELNDKTDKLAKAQKYIVRLQNRYISAQKATRHMISRHDEAVQRLSKLEQDTETLTTKYDEANQHVLQNLTKLEQQSENFATKQDEINQHVVQNLTKLEQQTENFATKQDEINQRVVQNFTKLEQETENGKNVVSNLQSFQRNENLAALENITPEVTTSAMHQLLKLLVPSTCYYWKQRGFTTSGYYTIDPDGEATGIEPFVVKCDMMTGETLFNHDSETKEQSHACSGPGCFKRSITYNASLKQITAVMKKSLSCKQHIELNCQQTSLQHDNESVSWWVDRYGNNHDYWAGNGDNGHTCRCGLTENCDYPGHVCNCNIDTVDSLFTDEGYLSNMSMLPVTELKFGHTSGNNKELHFKLGPLRCQGVQRITYPESCEDVWRGGSQRSGYYFLGKEDNVKLQFCNMEKLVDEDWRTEISDNSAQPTPTLELTSLDARFNQISREIITINGSLHEMRSQQDVLSTVELPSLDERVNKIYSDTITIYSRLREMRRRQDMLSTTVIFNAVKTTDYRDDHTYIVFNRVTVNIGDGYNSRTGKFRAPVSGVYVFSATAEKQYDSVTVISIRKNGRVLTYAYGSSDQFGETISCTVVTELEKGDEVGVYLKFGGILGWSANSNGYSTLFLGILLHK